MKMNTKKENMEETDTIICLKWIKKNFYCKNLS